MTIYAYSLIFNNFDPFFHTFTIITDPFFIFCPFLKNGNYKFSYINSNYYLF